MSPSEDAVSVASTSAAECENRAPVPSPAGTRTLPTTVGELIDTYMAHYAGRDSARVYRLAEWRARIGALEIPRVNDDEVHHALEAIAAQPARLFCGRDADGQPIYKRRRAAGSTQRRSPATVNRYHASLAAVFTWAIKRRLVPRGFENPCRKVERQRENSGVVRFLDADELQRLLAACKAARWPRLYALVLLAITTGARRGELERLTWGDIDLERAVAYVRESKNGEPKTLPLTPGAVQALSIHRERDAKRYARTLEAQLVFASRVKPDVPYNFEQHWRTALKAAQIRRFRFHDCRHTCASYLAQEGASLLEIADVMGHRQLAMVKRYAHLTVKSKAALVNRVLGEIA